MKFRERVAALKGKVVLMDELPSGLRILVYDPFKQRHGAQQYRILAVEDDYLDVEEYDAQWERLGGKVSSIPFARIAEIVFGS